MEKLKAWVQASRLPSQSYIFVPLFLGQSIFVLQGGELDLVVFVLVQLFGLFDQLYIVYANDCADLKTDKNNKSFTMFSGGSRVLVDNKLSLPELRWGAIIMAVLSVLTGLWFSVAYGRHLMILLVVIALALLWIYSYPPFRQSYRGGGELLQSIGTGAVLPIIGYYAQSGSTAGFPWVILAAVLPTSFACAVATSLPDVPSDAIDRKRTFAVLTGLSAAKSTIMILSAASIASLWVIIGVMQPRGIHPGAVIVPIAGLLGMLFFFRSKPGDPALTGLVAMSILVTLSISLGMAISFLT